MELSVSPDATTWTPLACAGWAELTGALAPAIRLAEAAADVRDGTPVEGTLPCAGAGRLWLAPPAPRGRPPGGAGRGAGPRARGGFAAEANHVGAPPGGGGRDDGKDGTPCGQARAGQGEGTHGVTHPKRYTDDEQVNPPAVNN